MLRYYAIATAIVVVFGCIVAALHRGGGDVRVASVQSTGSPSPPRTAAASTFAPGELTGTAPWALSALVDCFHQERAFGGSLEHVRRQLPRNAHPLGDAWVLVSGPCTVAYERESARVRRGPSGDPSVDVVIPPHLEVFVRGPSVAPQSFARRLLFVLRWKSADDARLDRLRAMPDARLQACCKQQ